MENATIGLRHSAMGQKVLRLALLPLLHMALCVAAEPVVATDLLRLRQASDVSIAHDGSFAVYSVHSIGERIHDASPSRSRYNYRDHIWLVNLKQANSRPLQLTFDEHSDTAAAISPDQTKIAWVRVDVTETDPKPQVWVMPVAEPGEARRLTDLPFGATEPRWSPDGHSLLVTSAIPISRLPGKPPFSQGRPHRDWWDFDRPETGKPVEASPDGDWRSIRNWLEANARNHNPEEIFRLDFLNEQGLAGERRFLELFRVDVGKGKPKPAVQLTSSYLDHSNASISPDGSTIVFSTRSIPEESPDTAPRRSSLWVVNWDGSGERPILKDDRYNFSLPQYTPDGKHIVAIGAESDEPTYRQNALVMCDSDGARPEWLTPDGDTSVQQPKVLEDKVYYTVNWQGGQHLRAVDYKSHQVKTLIDGPVGVNVFAVAPGKIVYGLITVPNPSELYLSTGTHQQTIDSQGEVTVKSTRHHALKPLAPILERAGGERAGATTRRLTDLNASWLETKEISLPEERWVRRQDGTRVQYWIMNPTRFDPKKTYPWVVEMHGGPAVMWGPGEYSMWHEFQMMCAFGFGVVYVNPRGSAGYGYPFQRANYKDWGDGPMGDVLAALDDAAAAQPAIDRRRLFLTGGSYAGYLTAWTIEHDHRFKAAVAQRGVYDLKTFFGEGNAFRLVPNEFGGYPWEPEVRRLLEQESPMTYVSRIETPLLILHGSQDFRTGVVQSQMLFRALKALGKPVEYIRYPDAGHELTRSGQPEQRMDHLLRIIEFFQRYSENDRPAPTAVETR